MNTDIQRHAASPRTLAAPASSRIYTSSSLHFYDWVVMGILARSVWGCPPTSFVDHYRRHVTANHADIAVGTGYCLDRCEFDTPHPRLALVDIREACLEFSARRLARYAPETYLRDARLPIQIGTRRFDSIGIGGLLHNLPGDMAAKACVFDSIAPIAAPGATVFGYTLVCDGVSASARRQMFHHLLNVADIVHNEHDRLADLAAEMSKRFVDSQLQLIGNIAFFAATVPDGTFARYTPGALT